jgi:Transposase DDE domain
MDVPRGTKATACRNRVGQMTECIFGWGKQHGTMRKTKHRGLARVATDFLLNLIAYNLIRIPTLLAA